MNTTKISIGLSGGVDSSVTAHLLQQSYTIDAFFMKNWESDAENCTSEEDFRSAKEVAKHLGIELHPVNFSSAYWDNVFQVCLDQLAIGQTPNPDILCNEKIKFSVFLDHALEQGASKIATGHYARVVECDEGFTLRQAKDRFKDQTYFLYRLNQRQLTHCLFPLGNYLKSEVRTIAKKANIPSASRKDSTGICFIGEQKYTPFIRSFLLTHPGTIVTESGLTIGQHQGCALFTIGQRKGLAIGGVKGAEAKPWYVIGKDQTSNTVIVSQNEQHPALWSTQLDVCQAHWISQVPKDKQAVTVKIRHGQAQTPAILHHIQDDLFSIQLERAVWAPCPGQSVVVYQDDQCLGGGLLKHYQGALTRA